MGELIACGAVSYETALGLTIPQIEFLYECHQRVQAANRAAFVADVQRAVVGSMGEEGFKAFQHHIALLGALADGKPPEGANGYTGDDAIVL